MAAKRAQSDQDDKDTSSFVTKRQTTEVSETLTDKHIIHYI